MSTDTPTTRPRASLRTRLTAGLAALVLLVLGGTAIEAIAPRDAAIAAGLGPGYGTATSYLGAYRVNGVNVYCLQATLGAPTGTTSYAGTYPWSTLDATGNARINWAITAYGQSSDPNWTAAVNMFVWSVADPGGYNSHGQAGDTWYIYRAPASARPAILNNLAYLRSASAGIFAGATSGSGQMTFQVDHLNNYSGTLTVSLSPTNATGSITLTNGIFLATGSPSIAGVTNGSVLQIRGVPPANGATYKISAVGNFSASGGYGGSISVYTTPGAQALGGPGPSGSVSFQLTATDPFDRSTAFRPTASTTVVSESVAAGETFKDVITFGLGADEDGTVNEWRRSATGEYLPVMARGTVYGPFIDRPVQSPTVPAGAPVAGHFTVTTTPEAGPTIPYTVESDQPLQEAGYYVAVVEIDWADQSPSSPPVQSFIPEGYHFQDDFGQILETSIVPFSLEFSTQLSDNEAVIGDEVTDYLTPRLIGGAWLRDGGTRVPVELTGTWYYSSVEPQLADTAPADAEVIATQTATLTGPGVVVETDPVQLPYREGWVTVQWCSTASVYVSAYCDDYGVPAETVRLAGPDVTTQAQEQAVPTDGVRDVAFVEGPVPSSGLELTFEGFLQPADAAAPVCTPDTLIYSSSSPVAVNGAGEYPSETFPVLPDHVGTVFWIETLRVPGTGEIVHAGECGLPNETTTIAWPSVVTAAVAGGGVGGTVYDVAIVDGLVPTSGVSVTFEGFLQPEDASAPVCTPETLVYSSSEPTVAYGPGEHRSEDFPVSTAEVGTIYWVETASVLDDQGAVVWQHVGECGLPNETTRTVEVTTQATATIVSGAEAFDTAIVRGSIPDLDDTGLRAELTFAAYRATGTEPICTDDELVFSTADEPIVLDGPGTYRSAATVLPGAGRYYWVETLSFVDEVTGDPIEVHVGECGLPAETTTVTSPPLALTGAAGAGFIWLGGGLLVLGGLLIAWRLRRTTSQGPSGAV